MKPTQLTVQNLSREKKKTIRKKRLDQVNGGSCGKPNTKEQKVDRPARGKWQRGGHSQCSMLKTTVASKTPVRETHAPPTEEKQAGFSNVTQATSKLFTGQAGKNRGRPF